MIEIIFSLLYTIDFSVFLVFFVEARGVGALVAGPLFETYGGPAMFFGCSMVAAATTIFYFFVQCYIRYREIPEIVYQSGKIVGNGVNQNQQEYAAGNVPSRRIGVTDMILGWYR